MPGGVSSPVRAFSSVGGNPVVFDKVKGAYAFDVDGNKVRARICWCVSREGWQVANSVLFLFCFLH